MDPTVSERVISADVEIRRKVALDLSDLPSAEALPHLSTLIGDPNWRVRKAAVEAVLSHPTPLILLMLLEALYDDDNAGRRNSAVETLIKVGSEALPRIYEHLIEEHVDVKLALINLLGEIPSRQSAPHLIYYLNHENKNLVSAAISSLGMLKDQANLNVLNDLLRREDPWIWFHLIDAFAEIGGPSTLDRLTQIYDTPRFRKAVLKAFGKMGSLQAVPFLLDRLEDPGTPLLEVMATLGRLYHANIPEALLARHRADMADMTRENFPIQSVEKLQNLWPEAKIPERRGMILVAGFLSELSLLDNVLDDLSNPYLQGDAFQAVQGYGGAAVASAIERLKALPPIENRLLLIKLLAASASSEAVGPLLEQVRDEDFQIRLEALSAIGFMDDERCVRELLSILKDPDETFHDASLQSISRILKRRADFRRSLLDPSREMVHSEEDTIRRAGYRLLAEASPQDTEPLVGGLQDPSPMVRQAVVQIVARHAGDRSFSLLLPLLEDGNGRVRRSVLTSLGRELLSRQPDVLQHALLDSEVWVRTEAAFHLAQSPDTPMADALLRLLQEDELPVRIGALRGLAEVGCGALFDRVMDAAKDEEEPLEVRQAALRALANSGRSESESILVACLGDSRWEIRSTAINIMGSSGQRRFIPVLLKELERDSDESVRHAIVEALIQLKAREAVPRMLHYLTHPTMKDDAYRFFTSLGREQIPLIEHEAQSVDFQTKLILIEILNHLENE